MWRENIGAHINAHSFSSTRGICFVRSVVLILVCMFALRMAEDWQDPEGKPDIFDLNTYFPILMMSEGVLVTCDKTALPVCWRNKTVQMI